VAPKWRFGALALGKPKFSQEEVLKKYFDFPSAKGARRHSGANHLNKKLIQSILKKQSIMEFNLNNFTYKPAIIIIDKSKIEPRLLKYVPSKSKWRHLTVRNSNGFIHFSSKGKRYKLHIETGDLHQGKNFIENIHDREEIVLKGTSI